jgi:NADH-quinone oxidoreductase subunit I
MANIVKEFVDSAAAIGKGLTITWKNMVAPTVTENYPTEPVHFEDRFRGTHILRRDENGLEKCVACFLCAAACPANCIYIEAAENTAEHRISAAERYAKVYNIDYNRCIFCGYCVEACPCDAITHGQGFEMAAYDTNTLVWRKEQLLEPAMSGPQPQDAPPRIPPGQKPDLKTSTLVG